MFLATAASALAVAKGKTVPTGLEMYSVRDDLKKDLLGTVRKVGEMGYQGVEFYSPYLQWTTDQAKEVRKVMDDVKLKCWSTHNPVNSFTSDIQKAIDLNGILGSNTIVMASPGRVEEGPDAFKKVAEILTTAQETFKGAKMRAGYHNHASEFKPADGKRAMDVLAANTPKDVVLQLDVGTCVEMGQDPVAWIKANPGRIRSMHLKDWSKEKGYRVLFGEGEVPWKNVIGEAVKTGGAEFYYIEQEGHDLPPFEAAKKCLENYRKLLT